MVPRSIAATPARASPRSDASDAVAGAVANPNRKNTSASSNYCSAKARRVHACYQTAGSLTFDTASLHHVGNEFAIKTMLGILPVKREAMANLPDDRVKT